MSPLTTPGSSCARPPLCSFRLRIPNLVTPGPPRTLLAFRTRLRADRAIRPHLTTLSPDTHQMGPRTYNLCPGDPAKAKAIFPSGIVATATLTSASCCGGSSVARSTTARVVFGKLDENFTQVHLCHPLICVWHTTHTVTFLGLLYVPLLNTCIDGKHRNGSQRF